MSAVQGSDDPAVVSGDGFADKVETTVCCWAEEGAVEVCELAGAEFTVCACGCGG